MSKPTVTPLIFVLMAASGCAALIYEIVWLQLLQLIIGSSAVSLGLLLGTYMGGLFLGSVAERVVRGAPCTVITVKPRLPETT